MAKMNINKLCNVKELDAVTVSINEEEVTVKSYLPLDEKTSLLSYIVQNAIDEQGFISPVRVQVYTTFGILAHYTNISFTDAQMKNIEKTYDLICINDIYNKVLEVIPEVEKNYIFNCIKEMLAYAEHYNNSVLGAFKIIADNYKETDFDLEKITSQIQDPQTVGFLKELMEKMG